MHFYSNACARTFQLSVLLIYSVTSVTKKTKMNSKFNQRPLNPINLEIDAMLGACGFFAAGLADRDNFSAAQLDHFKVSKNYF